MYAIIPRILIIALCATTAYKGATPSELIALLAAVTISSVCSATGRKVITYPMCALFVILCFFIPTESLYYLPIIVFELAWVSLHTMGNLPVFDKSLIPSCIGLAVVAGYAISSKEHALFIILMSLLSLFIAYACLMIKGLKLRALGEADDKRQLEELMEKRALDYKDKQDYEVHLATLKERNRIAREIHDNVGHLLSRALLMMGAIEAVNEDKNLGEHLSVLKNTLSDAMDSCRVSVHDLYDDSIDLKGSLEKLVEEFKFCPVTLEYSSGPKINKDVKFAVAGVVKEALSNIAKHSNATQAKIIFMEHEKIYQLLIEDNGTSATKGDGTGIGLNNMQDRITALGGTFYIRNENGFRIFATIPRAGVKE
ncbi:MAG: histidine kinase [Lachnospiraceae bacterium]|nr:histidine kinase [Lachnospiraceae bacterium]